MASNLPYLGNPGTIRGALMGLTIGGKFIDCETSCDFSVDIEAIPAASPNSARWAAPIPGVRSWTMSVNANLLLASVGQTNIKTVLDAVMTGEKLDLQFRTKPEVSPYLIIAGSAYPQSGSMTAGATGLANWNVTFQGAGPFTTDYEEFWIFIQQGPPDSQHDTVFIDDI